MMLCNSKPVCKWFGSWIRVFQLSVILAGCTSAPTLVFFVPDSANTNDLSGIQAYLEVERLTPKIIEPTITFRSQPEPSFSTPFNRTPIVPFSDIKSLKVATGFGESRVEVFSTNVDFAMKFYNENDAIAFSKAIYRFVHPISKREETSELAKFEDIAETCSRNSRDPSPVARAQVYAAQATDAVVRKDYWSAIRSYQQAIAAVPCWPDGYYNSALLLAEQNDYSDAIDQMSRYLLLVPGSPDAKRAQQEIWVWQGRIKGSSGPGQQ